MVQHTQVLEQYLVLVVIILLFELIQCQGTTAFDQFEMHNDDKKDEVLLWNLCVTQSSGVLAANSMHAATYDT